MTKKYSKDEIKKLKDETDYKRLDSMTEEEIEENAESDPESKTPSDDELYKFKKVKKSEKN